MKTIIVSEKPIAGQKIAEILSEMDYKNIREGKDPIFTFKHQKFGNVVLIPLKGHISDVDFPESNASWYTTNILELASKTKVLYNEKEKNIISLLKKEAEGTTEVIIATDADREGESIGREAVKYILSKNPQAKIKRAYFSAITKDELEKSFSDLQELNYNLADAADARREIDLIWGAALTRFLSIASKNTGKNFLSVGRVQSPTLAKIVEKELEIENFKSSPYWEIQVLLDKNKELFVAEHKKGRFDKEEDAKKAFAKITDKGTIIKVEKNKKELPKPVPFNTTDFLREASNLGFDAMKAMEIAEKLYMEGYISYPRTDNQKYVGVEIFKILNLLNQGEYKPKVEKIKAQQKIIPSSGKETKDHPPIHPVSYLDPLKVSKFDYKIYQLVVDRFLATLSENAITFVTKVETDINKEIFVSKGVIVEKKGWLEFYPYDKVKEEKLPDLKEGDVVLVKEKNILSKKTRPPARYSQGTLIKLMEDLNLGTKSTRPTIIDKLYSRQYILGKKQIQPSELAKAVVLSLQEHAKTVVEPEMTAKLEDEMNIIEEGKITKDNVVVDSRDMLSTIIKEMEKNKALIAEGIRKGKYNIEEFGVCPNCGQKLRKMLSRNNKWFVSCSGFPKCRTSYPLPQKGTISLIGYCDKCKSPRINLQVNDTDYQMCISPNCETNANWKKAQEERKEAAKNTVAKEQDKKEIKKKVVRKKKTNS